MIKYNPLNVVRQMYYSYLFNEVINKNRSALERAHLEMYIYGQASIHIPEVKILSYKEWLLDNKNKRKKEKNYGINIIKSI